MEIKQKDTSFRSKVSFTFHSLKIPSSTTDNFKIEWKFNGNKGYSEIFFSDDNVIIFNKDYVAEFALIRKRNGVYKDKFLEFKITRQGKTYLKHKLNVADYFENPASRFVLELQGAHKYPSYLTMSISTELISSEGIDITSHSSEQNGMTYESRDKFYLSEELDSEDKQRHENFFILQGHMKIENIRRSGSKQKVANSQDLFTKHPINLQPGAKGKGLAGFLNKPRADVLDMNKRINEIIGSIFRYNWNHIDLKYKHPVSVTVYKAFLEYDFLSNESSVTDVSKVIENLGDLIKIGINNINEKIAVILDLVNLIVMDPGFDYVSTRKCEIVNTLLDKAVDIINYVNYKGNNSDLIMEIVYSILDISTLTPDVGQKIKGMLIDVDNSGEYFDIYLPLVKNSIMYKIDSSLINSLLKRDYEITFSNTCHWKSVLTCISSEQINLPMFETVLNFLQIPYISNFDKDNPKSVLSMFDRGSVPELVVLKLLSELKFDSTEGYNMTIDNDTIKFYKGLCSDDNEIRVPDFIPDFTDILEQFKQKDIDETVFDEKVSESFKFFNKHF